MDSPTSLVNLPDALLETICRQLSARDLAALCVQDVRMKAVASDYELWRVHALNRWPFCSIEAYSGDWKKLYGTRATLPPQLVTAVDRCRQLTAKTREIPFKVNSNLMGGLGPAMSFTSLSGMLFREVMQGVYTGGLCVSLRPSLKKHVEYQGHCKDVRVWLIERPQLMMKFIKDTIRDSQEVYQCMSDQCHWEEIAWRRSALAFFMAMNLEGICLSVINNIQSWLETLDSSLRHVMDSPHFAVEGSRPLGLPHTHWWFGRVQVGSLERNKVTVAAWKLPEGGISTYDQLLLGGSSSGQTASRGGGTARRKLVFDQVKENVPNSGVLFAEPDF